MRNFFIIHGTEASPYSNWFGWLHNKIEHKGYKCFCPQFPTIEGQTFNNWQEILNGYNKLGIINSDTTFICHSSACVFVIKYCINNNIKIKKLISVCGFNNALTNSKDYDKANSTFFIKDVSPFLELCKDRVCFYSDNDPYIKLEDEKAFADSIKAEHVLIKKGGHLNLESGYKELNAIELYLMLPNFEDQSF